MRTRIKYDMAMMQSIALFERVSHAEIKDCFEDRNKYLIFVVEPGQMSKAIGRNGSTVRKLEFMLKRKIKILEFNPEIEKFVRTLIQPSVLKDVLVDNQTLTLVSQSSEAKRLLIGRESQNLKQTKSIIQRYFDSINDIK